MEQTLFSRKQLAERWGFSSTKVLEKYESEGIIKRVQGLPCPRYSIIEIEKIENLGQDIDPLSPLERRRLERRISELEIENEKLKTILTNIKIANVVLNR